MTGSSERAELGHFGMSIGLTNAMSEIFVETVMDEDDNSDDDSDIKSTSPVDDADVDDMFENLDYNLNIDDLDAFMASAMEAGKEKGINAEHLLKIWRISFDDVK